MRSQCRPCSGPSPLQLNLNLKNKFGRRERAAILDLIIGLPQLFGSPIVVSALPGLRAFRGKLLSSHSSDKGKEVYAASFIRKREIVLETQLLSQRGNLRLILAHEIFHFVWSRLGNPLRQSFRSLILEEMRSGARGELGESATVHKDVIVSSVNAASSAAWREYVCESFCDSGSWLFAGVTNSKCWTLAPRWCTKRQQWFTLVFSKPRAC